MKVHSQAVPRNSAALRRVLIVCVVSTGVLFAACGDGTAGTDPTAPDDEAFNGAVQTPPPQVGSVVLPDVAPGSDGAPLSMKAPENGILLVYFGFTQSTCER